MTIFGELRRHRLRLGAIGMKYQEESARPQSERDERLGRADGQGKRHAGRDERLHLLAKTLAHDLGVWLFAESTGVFKP